MNDTMTMPARIEEQSTTLAPMSDAASLMGIITRIAQNPDIDLARIEKMLDMYERVNERQAKAAYAAAFSEMQADLPAIVERGEIKIRDTVQSRYALWEDINDQIKPVLARHGFGLSFRTGYEGDKIIVTGILSHREGHSEQTTMHLPTDMSGSKNAVQGVGSSTSYGKRYVASALLNLTSRGEDDDGMTGGGRFITDAQRDALNILADNAKADKRLFCEWLGVDSFDRIPARDYKKAETGLQDKLAANNKRAAR